MNHVTRPCCTSTENNRHDDDCGRLLKACLRLREFYIPGRQLAGGLECISYPFPENGKIAIKVRQKDEPTTMQQVGIPESDWRNPATSATLIEWQARKSMLGRMGI